MRFSGHAIECRINAENPERGFAPNPGKITAFVAPGGPGVRFDSHVYAGYEIPPYYDSMIGKLIVRGETREEALAVCRRALDEFEIEGVVTTVPFLKKLVRSKDFVAGHYDTGFVENFLQEIAAGRVPETEEGK